VTQRALISVIEQRMATPTARGLAHGVSRAIREGELPVGTHLPAIRDVARELGLSPTTVSAAWRLLAGSGAITTDGRRGTRVSDSVAHGPVRYRRAVLSGSTFAWDLSTGVPDAELLPLLATAEFSTAGTPTSYLDDPVVPELEELIRASWPYDPEAVTVVDGAMDGLDLVSRVLLRFGDRVVVEHPCFPPLVDLLEASGVEIVGVPIDDEGMSAEGLAAALETPARAVFLQPRGQNPTGVTMSERRSIQLAEVLQGSDTWVVEDDSTASLGLSDPVSLGSHLPGQVVHIRSYSKSHGPDLRLAALSAPELLMGDLLGRRQLGQGWSSRLLQRILIHLLTDPTSIAQVEHARSVYARRRGTLVTALAERGLAVGGQEGLNLWVPVVDETAALLRLASQGIGVAPGQPFSVLPESRGFIRVTIAAAAADLPELPGLLADAAEVGSWEVSGR
jgi:DNA-binding transcriptional MocR family regulator